MPPAVCVPAPTLSAVAAARLAAVLLRLPIVAVAPLKLAVPPLAVVMLAGPATLIVPLDNVVMFAGPATLIVPVDKAERVAPPAKFVAPAPLSAPSVIMPVALVKLTLPELAKEPNVRLAPDIFIAAPEATVA